MYSITPHTKRQAQKLGVTVKPSTRKGKKIDVYKNGKLLASVGAIGYTDYGTLLQKGKRTEAADRRKRYKARHASNRKRKGTPGWYADRLLW